MNKSEALVSRMKISVLSLKQISVQISINRQLTLENLYAPSSFKTAHLTNHDSDLKPFAEQSLEQAILDSSCTQIIT